MVSLLRQVRGESIMYSVMEMKMNKSMQWMLGLAVSIGLMGTASAVKKDPAADFGGGPVSGGMMDANSGPKGIISTGSAAAEARAEKYGKAAAMQSIARDKAKASSSSSSGSKGGSVPK